MLASNPDDTMDDIVTKINRIVDIDEVNRSTSMAAGALSNLVRMNSESNVDMEVTIGEFDKYKIVTEMMQMVEKLKGSKIDSSVESGNMASIRAFQILRIYFRTSDLPDRYGSIWLHFEIPEPEKRLTIDTDEEVEDIKVDYSLNKFTDKVYGLVKHILNDDRDFGEIGVDDVKGFGACYFEKHGVMWRVSEFIDIIKDDFGHRVETITRRVERKDVE